MLLNCLQVFKLPIRCQFIMRHRNLKREIILRGSQRVRKMDEKKKILGIDYGDANIGLAMTDELWMFAHTYKTLKNTGLNKFIEEIKNIVTEEEVGEVIMGLPLNMDGSTGPQAQKVIDVISKMSEAIDVPIVPWDERLTTWEAERYMIEADLSRKKRAKKIDELAAKILLQGYIDHKKQMG